MWCDGGEVGDGARWGPVQFVSRFGWELSFHGWRWWMAGWLLAWLVVVDIFWSIFFFFSPLLLVSPFYTFFFVFAQKMSEGKGVSEAQRKCLSDMVRSMHGKGSGTGVCVCI